MKFKIVATVFALSSLLASCMSEGGYDPRYGKSYPSQDQTAVDAGNSTSPDTIRGGWVRDAQTRQAEQKSITRDTPFAVVKPDGSTNLH